MSPTVANPTRSLSILVPTQTLGDRAASLANHSRLAQRYAKRAIEYEGDEAGLRFESLAFGHAAGRIGDE